MDAGDIAADVFLAYYMSGLTMVAFHSTQHPLDKPGYVRRGTMRKIIAGAVWPLTAYLCGEFAWHAIAFAANVPVIAVCFWLTGFIFDSDFLRLITVVAACYTPIVVAPASLIGLVLWSIFAKPFGLQFPAGVGERFR
jgi:hypothetical protein